jgi:hypothetical protein
MVEIHPALLVLTLGTEAQARRYLDYHRILLRQKRKTDRALEVAVAYLERLDPALAASLRQEYGL